MHLRLKIILGTPTQTAPGKWEQAHLLPHPPLLLIQRITFKALDQVVLQRVKRLLTQVACKPGLCHRA